MMKFSKMGLWGFCATCLTAFLTWNLKWLWLGAFILAIGLVVEAFMLAPVSGGYAEEKVREKKSTYNEREHEIYYHLYLNKRR